MFIIVVSLMVKMSGIAEVKSLTITLRLTSLVKFVASLFDYVKPQWNLSKTFLCGY